MNKYLDFDKKRGIFYYNIYAKDIKLVVKIPICQRMTEKKQDPESKVEVEKFDLTKHTFLLNCEQNYSMQR